MNLNQLKSALQDPALSGLTDFDVNALPGFGVPILVPKTTLVTYTTLAAVWGTQVAATFHEKILVAVQGNDALSAVIRYIDKLLQGPGIDPANAEVPAYGAQFVAAGLATQEHFTGVFFNAVYKAGTATTVADITAGRAALAFENAKNTLAEAGAAIWNQWIDSVTVAHDVSQFPQAATLPGGNG